MICCWDLFICTNSHLPQSEWTGSMHERLLLISPDTDFLEPLKTFCECHLPFWYCVCSLQVRDICQFLSPPPCSSNLVPSGVHLWYCRFSGATAINCLIRLCFSSLVCIQNMTALYQLPKTDETDNRQLGRSLKSWNTRCTV